MLAKDVAQRAETDPVFLATLKADPVGTLRAQPDALRTDVWVYRGIVLFLGLVAAGGLALVAVIVLDSSDPVPEIFTAAISAAIGALAGMLVPPPQTND
jgi:hypothetical protein